jgi:hypothetical protein
MRITNPAFRYGLWLTALILCAWACLAADNIPGWFKAGKNPGDYDMGIDSAVTYNGGPSGFIRSNKLDPKNYDAQNFGTYMQIFNATDSKGADYRGKRMRFSAFVKSIDVQDWAGLWMRVDGPAVNGNVKALAFDNMQQRPITGTRDWVRCAVVLDVAEDADKIAFGVLLHGPGAVWINDVQFTEVSSDVPVTDMVSPGPRNLNFNE